jgi:hypothetical protein
VAEAGREGKVCDIRVGHDVLLGWLAATFMLRFWLPWFTWDGGAGKRLVRWNPDSGGTMWPVTGLLQRIRRG